MKLIFEKSRQGRKAVSFPILDVPEKNVIPRELLRQELNLPEVSEVDIVRHYIAYSKLNYGVDDGFYPLGSCTMKYNPKINEDVARLEGFANLHPYSEENQGALQLMHELQNMLCEITGMHSFTLQPAAGAHGELTGLMIMKAYFRNRGEQRTKIIVPDSSHGTNPATANMCGMETVTIRSNAEGEVDIDDLKANMAEDVAGLMLTNPNTIGLFDKNVQAIAGIVHRKGGLCYCDGANMNAIAGIAKPAEMGFDIMHLNLHKTFSTPHGGGGPGSGPVGVAEKLADYLPVPRVIRKDGIYALSNDPQHTIGRVKAFYGNFGMLIRAYAYIKTYGTDIRTASENAVLNANYLAARLKKHFNMPYDRLCQHEFVLNDNGMPNGVTTNHIAKRLLDYGIHAPTIYFPLIVPGAIMIEPTETESREMLDYFIESMLKIKKEAEEDPELVKNAPHTTPVSQLDGVKAARNPVLRWKKNI